MCNYKYTSDYKHLPRSMGKECPYTKIYTELKNNGTYNFENITTSLELPLDSHGICIFHSNELEWKRKNNFAIKFLKLLQFLDIYSSFEFQVGKLFRFVTSDDLTSEQKTEFLTAFNRLSGSNITLEALDKDNLEVAIRKQCASESVAELEKPLKALCKELKGNHPLKTYKSLYDYSRLYYDFVEFVFVGEYSKLSKNVKVYIFNLTDLTLNKEANFTGALFIDRVEFDQIKFNGGATFQQARFNGELKMKNICFNGADFAKTIFEQTASFDDIDFLSYALFLDSQFTYSSYADGYSFIFNNSRFHYPTDFSGANVKSKDNNSSVAFKDVNFKDSVNFTGSIFDCTVSFRNVEFDAIVEFIDTSFNTTKSTSRHREYAVEFVKITVNEKGSLIFQSTDPQNKMFKQDVRFSFKKEIEGTIKFENANFNNIDDVSRRKLLLLSKLGKVEIGSGCLKYRFQTEIRTILINGDNQPLILELTQTFINYFTAKNGFNLGFEILERDNSKISFFYFTDENITRSEFLDRLQETEQDLWNLTTTGFDEQFLLSDGKVETDLSKENAIINAIDGISALTGTFFRVGTRIAFEKWSPKDTKALLNAVDFNNQPLLDAENLHQVLLDKYTGRVLFLMRDRQNPNLVLFSKPYRLIEENPNLGTITKTKILFLAANPSNSRLKSDEEVREIQTNLKLAKERDNLELKQEWAVTVKTLMQALVDESPTIVHFSGHGQQAGIILQDEIGEPKVVSTDALENLFKLFKVSIKCVILNSCYSETQAKVIRSHIPHVIGMESEISDKAAIAFSTGFYKAIGSGSDIPFAFELGIAAIKLEGLIGDNIPVLL